MTGMTRVLQSIEPALPGAAAPDRSAMQTPPKHAEPGTRRALLIWNRKSRKGETETAPVLEMLVGSGIEIIEQRPGGPGHIADLIRSHRGEVGAVILAGGDGTMNAAAHALMETGLPLGILPTGTANDLARTLGIPLDLTDACRVIADGYVQRVDLGCVNGVHFFNAANIGVGAGVTRRLTDECKGRWGVLGYALRVYDAVGATRSFSALVTCDGQSERLRSIQITVGNGRHHGGGMTVAGDAAIDDSRLDMYSIRPQSFLRLIKLAPRLRTGTQDRDDAIDVRSGREIEIRTRRPKSVSTDGELTTHTPARFHIERAAVSIYVPPPDSDGAR